MYCIACVDHIPRLHPRPLAHSIFTYSPSFPPPPKTFNRASGFVDTKGGEGDGGVSVVVYKMDIEEDVLSIFTFSSVSL